MFWDSDTEIDFFEHSMKIFSDPEKLFYLIDKQYFAYSPKGVRTKGKVVQGRNSLIGKYTEKWCKNFLSPIAQDLGYYCVNGVVCPELGLTKSSDADIAFCTTPDKNQLPSNIKLIFEVKMSIVNNYTYEPQTKRVVLIGDLTTHKGIPSILRSDSMLKAIGKSVNIRVSGFSSSKIPIIVLGNSPISKSYISKVDFLKMSGVIQSFISVYPNPIKEDVFKNSPEKGFNTFSDYDDLKEYIKSIVHTEMNFFSSMISMKSLGNIITLSTQEPTKIKRAKKFLELLKL